MAGWSGLWAWPVGVGDGALERPDPAAGGVLAGVGLTPKPPVAGGSAGGPFPFLPGATSVVPPTESDPLHCAPAKQGVATSATFTVAAVCPPINATITFTPVAGPPGIQKKLAGTSISVTVTDTTSSCTGGGGPPSPGGHNPAAPAVTNAYLNANSAVVSACQGAIGGRNWRGQLLSFIAHWMPLPESVKDTYFSDPNDWILYVETEVNMACDVANGGFLEPNGSGSQSDATFTSPPLSAYAPFVSLHK